MTQIVSFQEEIDRRKKAGVKVQKAVLKKRISEMITTSDGLMDLIQKVRVDVAFGQAEVPLLYQPIYRNISPAGGFPGRAVDVGENTLQANVVFMQKMEGGEVEFGVLVAGVPKTARLYTWAAGFQWDEDMVEWDETWRFELVNQAFGRGYNYLLNHLHLSPIFAPPVAYGAGNSTPASVAGASVAENTLLTFQDAFQEAVQAVPQRTPSVILASEVDRFQIEQALLKPVLDGNGNELPTVPVSTIIYYDGATVDMGTEIVTYPGVTPGECYFIFPKQKMLELVHHELRVDADNADITRLIEAAVVGRTRRGVYAILDESVEKITLP